MKTTLAEQMTLDIIRTGLKTFTPPQTPHDPHGDWTLNYVVYTLAGDCAPAGNLTLTRKRIDDHRHTLTLAMRKLQAANAHQTRHAEIECMSDDLGTPIAWQWQVDFLKPDDQPWPGMKLSKKGCVLEQGIEIDYVPETSGASRIHAVKGPLAIEWGLWEAVGRLPRETGRALDFTLIEDFDQCKDEQKLMYKKNIELMWPEGDVNAKPLTLHAFDHLGRGMVPFTYWVDDAGRLIAAVSGIEAYILATTKNSVA